MFSGHIWLPLRSSDYRKLWFGQMISVIGDKVDQIALGILVYGVTGSMLQMGVMLAISTLPAALFGLPAGALVDRWDHRVTMVVSDLLRAALVLSIPFVVIRGAHGVYAVYPVYAVAFLVGLVSVFFEPAKLSLIPELVEPDHLVAANSLDNASASVAELLGLGFAAALVATLGYRVAFFLDAGTFVLSALFIMLITYRQQSAPAAEQAPRLIEQVGLGLRYIRDVPVLRDLLSVYMVAATGVSASITIVYVLALERYKAGAAGLASLDAAITVGLLVGSFAVGHTGLDGAGRRFIQGLCAFGFLFAALAFAPGMPWAIALLLAGGIANMWFQIPMATLLQHESQPQLRGRVFAAKSTLTKLVTVVGYVGAGFLAERVGVTVAILAVGGLVVLAGLIGLSRPALRAA